MRSTTVASRNLLALAAAAVCGLTSQAALALVIAPINSASGIETTLTNALLAPSSGISIVGGSITYQGINTASIQQSGTYSGFNLAPSTGATPTLSLANGILLTSGSAALPLTNTTNQFNV